MNLYFHFPTRLHGAVLALAHGRLHQMYPGEMTPTDTVFTYSFARSAQWNRRCIWRADKDNLMVAAGSSSLLLSLRNASSCLGLLYFGTIVPLPINSGTFNLKVWSSWPIYALHRIWQIDSTLKTSKGHITSVYPSRCHLLSIRSVSYKMCLYVCIVE